ncbi:MAG: type II toxin-antitoxin system VapB family antitoxin [Opitutae bacterium]|nr:type II toxin-antitoxin system VapB family antitoxin [Opitutae bacterium]MDG1300833.1 type II toxin-antitoxin system VapB family antitoxin [Opitutae bacterium]
MRTTLNLDDKIFEQASKLSGIKLLHERLKNLIAKESAQRLSMLGGPTPQIQKTLAASGFGRHISLYRLPQLQ